MKSLKLVEAHRFELINEQAPIPSTGEELITVEAVGLGGSEYLGFRTPGIRPLPIAMGHGVVGEDSRGKRVAIYPLSGCGECHYCLSDKQQLCDDWALIGVQHDGGFSQKLTVAKDQVFELPSSLSIEQAVFIEPFANAVNAWELSGGNSTHRVGVIGVGSLGLGVIAIANAKGVPEIVCFDRSSVRCSAALELGACAENLLGSCNFDIVFDTVGSEETRQAALNACKKGGCVVLLGFEQAQTSLNFSELIRHEKTIKGSFVYNRTQFQQAIDLAHRCKPEWVELIRYHQVSNTLDQFLCGNFDVVKVALKPNG